MHIKFVTIFSHFLDGVVLLITQILWLIFGHPAYCNQLPYFSGWGIMFHAEGCIPFVSLSIPYPTSHQVCSNFFLSSCPFKVDGHLCLPSFPLGMHFLFTGSLQITPGVMKTLMHPSVFSSILIKGLKVSGLFSFLASSFSSNLLGVSDRPSSFSGWSVRQNFRKINLSISRATLVHLCGVVHPFSRSSSQSLHTQESFQWCCPCVLFLSHSDDFARCLFNFPYFMVLD